MVHRCCISACGMNVRVAEAKGHKGLTYHCFPLKEPNRGKWIQVVLPHVDKPEGFKIVQGYTRVCSRHFRRKDYSLDSRKRARLNSNAVPSIFHPKSPSAPVSSESLLENTLPLRTTQDSSYINFSLDTEINFKNDEKNGPSLLLGSAATTNDQLILPLTHTIPIEYSTSKESPTYKRLENDTVSNKNKSTHHKRRRSNRAPVHRSSKSHKTTPTPDELNIEGVGEALAEINLSTLMAVYPDHQEDKDDGSKDVSSEMLPPEAKRVTPSEDRGSSPKLIKPNVSEELLEYNLLNEDLETPTSKSEEQELLQSIQAVNIHCQEPTAPHSTPSERSKFTILNSVKEESQIKHELDELLCGNSVLDDPSLLSFDSQDFLEAIRSTNDDFPSADEIDQLACHLNSSFLDNEGLQPLLLDLDEIRISDLELPIPATFNTDNWIDFGNDMISQLSHISFEPAAEVSKQPEKQLEEQREVIPDTPKRKITPPSPPPTVSSDSSPEIKPPPTPVTNKAASKKNSNCTGRFSAERFNGSDKDIEYYTGFSSYQSFESFYYSLEGHAEKLKVTDIMYGAGSVLHASNDSQQDSSNDEPGGSSSGPGSYVEDGRRLSQGRSMIRIDELFMTLIRLKRKLPEKVLGHMFCTSQSTVSRTVRAWVMLLSKVVETMPSKSTSPKCRKSNSSPNLCTDENNYTTPNPPGTGIPDSVLKLFNSDLARSIVSSGNSRKTSSSTCTSTSRSKRPKKEKMAALDNSTPLPSPDPIDLVSEDTTPNDVSVCENRTLTEDSSLVRSDQVSSECCGIREPFTNDIVQNDFSITPIV